MDKTDWGFIMRRAFTLIELLVVISIIAVLIGLLLPAVMRVRATGIDTKNRVEITSLASAVQMFNTTYGFNPPSPFVLAEKYSDANESIVRRMWPRIASGNNWTTPKGYIDWNENGVMDGPVTLSNSQCLVFFLSGYNGLGFSPNNVVDPSDTSDMLLNPRPQRKFFYTFQSSRFVGAGYQEYMDVYGTPINYDGSSVVSAGADKIFGTSDDRSAP